MNKMDSEINTSKVPEYINGKASPPPDCKSQISSLGLIPLEKCSPKSRWGGVKTDVGNAYWEQYPWPKE